jgi:hypothetical protein
LLLALPREIRDEIIALVLASTRDGYSSIEEAEPTRATKENPDNVPFLSLGFGRGRTHFEQPFYTTNSLPLLLVNHQISSEAASAIARLSTHPISYELDVMFVNEVEIWPTWLRVPVLAKQLEDVNVTIRTLGTPYFNPRYDQWRRGNGGPSQLVWCFYYLLEHVIRRGCLPYTSSSLVYQVSIISLNLNFVGLTGEPCEDNDRYSSISGERVLRPAFVADFLKDHIQQLLQMNYDTAEYGGILYERIGKIRISVNGEQQDVFDMGEILSKLSYHDHRLTFGHICDHGQRLPVFWEWKNEAYKKREERGLPVTLAIDDEMP